MGRFVRSLTVVVCFVLLPATAFAQAALSGVVKDASGAVLPGVSVEAASPVLIEKVRAAVTGGDGQYRIIDLRPGTYTVTFTLAGFSVIRRDGVDLTGNVTTTVNAELRVGGLEETITVTGAAATVDVQSSTRQMVLDKATIDALPGAKLYSSLGLLATGVTINNPEGGGAFGDTMASLTVHGSRTTDQRIMQNGVNTMTLQAGGNIGIAVPNATAASEVTINTAANDAESQTGGVGINFIPKDGGNKLSVTYFTSYTNESMQGDNLTQRLKALGLKAAGGVKKNMDVSGGVGGPILRDRLWFYGVGRYTLAQAYAADMFVNKNAYNPRSFTFEPDLSQPGYNNSNWKDAQIRFTFQATPKNKVAFTWDQQFRCSCPGGPGTSGVTSTRTPEAAGYFRSPTQQLLHAEWSSPVTSNLLLEAVALHRTERWGFMHPQASISDTFINDAQTALESVMIPATELSTGLSFRARPTYNNTWVPNYYARFAATYITGAHAFKVGYNDVIGFHDQRDYTQAAPLEYRLRNGRPEVLRIRALPIRYITNQNHDLGLFAQDRWTRNRLTLTAGIRFDYYDSSFPEQTVGASLATPTRDLKFAPEQNINWKDVSPRLGVVYDVGGDGKTAVKVSLNRYVNGQTLNALGRNNNPVLRLVTQADRNWTDNGDFVPDCDLANLAANGECGPISNPNFGLPNPNSVQYSKELMRANRNFNWEFSAGVQREIVPRVSADVSFFRRWYGNFQITDNAALSAADYTSFKITIPAVNGLTSSGQTLSARDPINRNTISLNTVDNDQLEHWNGVDISLNARLQNGVFLRGGFSTGRTSINQCGIGNTAPEILFRPSQADPKTVLLPVEWCDMQSPFLSQFKGSGAYTLPKVDVQVSANFISAPGPEIVADYPIPAATVVAALGRPQITSGLITMTGIKPMSEYGERLNQTDIRVSKIFRIAGTRSAFNFDVFNLFNADTIIAENPNFAAFRAPTAIVLGRYMKVGVQFDF